MARSRTASPDQPSSANLGFEARLWFAADKLRNLHQSRTLATLRDTLLPKLLGWDLSVAAVEKESAP